MPVTSHLVNGKVFDLFGDALSGATVSLKHIVLDETLPSVTSNAQGEYILNLSGLSSQWSKGQEIQITAFKTTEGTKTETTTIQGTGGQTVNLTLAETSDFVFDTLVQDRTHLFMAMPVHYDGKKVTRTRPLPVLSNLQGWNGTNWRGIVIDSITRHLATITHVHHTIHEGNHFFVRDFVDLGNGATRDMLLITPNTAKLVHLIIAIEHELEGSVKIYEGTVTSADGIAITTINRNRNSSGTPGLVVTHTPTVSSAGTLLEQDQKGSAKKFGAEGRDAEELLLKRNTKYLLRMTNETANNNLFNWTLDWYERFNEVE